MVRKVLIPALVVASLAVGAPLSAEVRVTMDNGKVTLKANNATVREILAEWAKVGRARVINGERVTGSPLTLELTDVPEGQALDIILRSVAGYMAAPRAVSEANASIYDRIMILPTSTAPRVAPSAPAPSIPTFAPPPVMSTDEDDARVQIPRPPIFNTFPPVAPPTGIPGAPAAAPAGRGTAPGQMPVGVTVPGMIVQPANPNPQQLPFQIPQ